MAAALGGGHAHARQQAHQVQHRHQGQQGVGLGRCAVCHGASTSTSSSGSSGRHGMRHHHAQQQQQRRLPPPPRRTRCVRTQAAAQKGGSSGASSSSSKPSPPPSSAAAATTGASQLTSEAEKFIEGMAQDMGDAGQEDGVGGDSEAVARLRARIRELDAQVCMCTHKQRRGACLINTQIENLGQCVFKSYWQPASSPALGGKRK